MTRAFVVIHQLPSFTSRSPVAPTYALEELRRAGYATHEYVRSFIPLSFPCSSTVEHLAVNEGVTGSNPVGGAI